MRPVFRHEQRPYGFPLAVCRPSPGLRLPIAIHRFSGPHYRALLNPAATYRVESHADIGCPGSRLRTQPLGPPWPWVGTLYGPAECQRRPDGGRHRRGRGRDGAVLVSPFSMYRYDASYAKEVYAAHPDRFRLVKPVDPTNPAVADTIADWVGIFKGTVGIRVFLRDKRKVDRPCRPCHQPGSGARRRSTRCRSTWRAPGA